MIVPVNDVYYSKIVKAQGVLPHVVTHKVIGHWINPGHIDGKNPTAVAQDEFGRTFIVDPVDDIGRVWCSHLENQADIERALMAQWEKVTRVA